MSYRTDGTSGKDQVVIGVLMLDSGPPFRVPGCAGSDDTYSFQLKRRIVKGATVSRMTSDSSDLLAPILEAAGELEGDGVDAIMGNCGFMAIFQDVLRQKVSVPVFTSSLLLVPLVAGMLPKGKRIGILTYKAPTLTETHYLGAGWSSKDVPIAVAGVQDKPAWRLFMTPEHPFHEENLRRELLSVCDDFVAGHPDLGALVLECTAMPPFAHTIHARFGLPVFDISTLAALVADSLGRKAFQRRQA